MCSVCYCARLSLYVTSLLLMRLSLLSDPPINVSVLCPVDASPFLSMLPSVNVFLMFMEINIDSWDYGILIAGIFGIMFCLILQPSALLMCHFCLSCQCIPPYAVLLMCTSLRFFLPLIYQPINRSINRSIGEYLCLGFEIDTTCPHHRQFFSVDRRPNLC